MSTPKHTPGPIHNGRPSLGQPCTCCILLRTGEPLESVHGDQPCSDISRIELCPKHAAAPAMYEALLQSLQTAENWACQCELNGEGINNPAAVAVRAMKAALAQAEGSTK